KIAIGAVVLGRAGDAGFASLYAVTTDAEASSAFRAKGAEIIPDRTQPFHFGQELQRIVRERKLDRVCTIGAGAGALLTTAELRVLQAWQDILSDRIDALMRLVTTPDKELLVAGRVGAPVWTFIETQTACRVRMLAEERGMQAAGRDTSGEARSALGFLYRE